MNEEELLEKNNIILSHNKLPKGMSTCENYGLSGNCGIKCPLFKNGTCEVYKDVAERIINNLQSKIDKVNKILNANTHVENIYHALCNLFDEEYQYEIDNEELNDILKEDK